MIRFRALRIQVVCAKLQDLLALQAAAMENWENLYYCHRNDCVFVPGKGTYAPIEKLQQYLYE